jgi:hypothetical protein
MSTDHEAAEGASDSPKVLIIGLDPRSTPGVDAELIETGLKHGQARFKSMGIDADLCLVALDEHAQSVIAGQLQRESYACVIVGGGIRKPPELLEFFETVINLIRRHAPNAAIGFNTNAADSADAAVRCLGWSDDAFTSPDARSAR